MEDLYDVLGNDGLGGGLGYQSVNQSLIPNITKLNKNGYTGQVNPNTVTSGMDGNSIKSYNGTPNTGDMTQEQSQAAWKSMDIPATNQPVYTKINSGTTGYKDINGNIWDSEADMQKANLDSVDSTKLGASGNNGNSWSSGDIANYGMVGLGVGQLGLGIASYLENSKTANKQRALLDQQIANNKYALDTAKARQSDISSAFGKK